METPAIGGGTARVPGQVRLGLLIGASGYSVAQQIVTILALRFLTDSLAVAAGVAAAIFALTKFYDGLIDPVMGVISDRTTGRLGRRLPYMILATVLLPLSVAAIFNVPQLPSTIAMTAVIAAALLVYGTAITIWAVPFMAMVVELSSDYHERSTLMAYRAYGNSFGIMLGSTIAPWLLAYWGRTAAAHSRMSLIVAAVIFALLAAAVLLLRGVSGTTPRSSDHRLFSQLKTAWANRPFRTLAFVHICFLFGVACSAASNAYFTRDVLGASDVWLGTFYVVLLLGTLVATPLWLIAARRFDKKAAYMASLALYGLLTFTWIMATPAELYTPRVVRVFLIGSAMGGVIVLGYSMLSDAIRYDFVQSGQRREGTFSGAMSLIDKTAGAMGVACMGMILSLAGYVSSSTGGGEAKSSSVVWGLYANFAVIPAVTALLSVLLLSRYRLTAADLQGDVS